MVELVVVQDELVVVVQYDNWCMVVLVVDPDELVGVDAFGGSPYMVVGLDA